MTVEFIGMIQPRDMSEIHPRVGRPSTRAMSAPPRRRMTRGGFDRILIGWHSNGPDGFQIAAHCRGRTPRRSASSSPIAPVFARPTCTARDYATLDQLTEGRAAIHVISGGDDADQLRDGRPAAQG